MQGLAGVYQYMDMKPRCGAEQNGSGWGLLYRLSVSSFAAYKEALKKTENVTEKKRQGNSAY